MATAALPNTQAMCHPHSRSHCGKAQYFQKKHGILNSRHKEMTQHRAYVVSAPFFKVSSNTQGQKFCISLYLSV